MDAIITPIVFRKELKYRKVQTLAQSHTGSKWLGVAEGLGKSHTGLNLGSLRGGRGSVIHSVHREQMLLEHLLCLVLGSRDAAGNKPPSPVEHGERDSRSSSGGRAGEKEEEGGGGWRGGECDFNRELRLGEASTEQTPEEAQEPSRHLGGRAFGQREQPRQELGKREQRVDDKVQPWAFSWSQVRRGGSGGPHLTQVFTGPPLAREGGRGQGGLGEASSSSPGGTAVTWVTTYLIYLLTIFFHKFTSVT